MAGRRRVEHDVVVALGIAGQQAANSSNAAISVVQAPESCSRTVESSASVSPRPICSITRRR